MAFSDVYGGARVLVTGHTGFKGSWLALWLSELGADVFGISLPPPTSPSLFEAIQLEPRLKHHVCDIRDYQGVENLVREARPDFVFHLAAQPLVRLSYDEPLETLETNVMGTAHVLTAVRNYVTDSGAPCVTLVITSDKCYQNCETYVAYSEEDRLGGHDVYSMSKAATELVTQSWRDSFFSAGDSIPNVLLSSVRAGNVIGGGDWALDRIVPDAIRALSKGEPIPVRNPKSIRPWQHVLEPLSGYLHLASLSKLRPDDWRTWCSAWNFGPGRDSERTVAELCDLIVESWGEGDWLSNEDPNAVHEARFLKLSTEKAWFHLNWKPAWAFERTVQETVEWYREARDSNFDAPAMQRRSLCQLQSYTETARELSLQWAM